MMIGVVMEERLPKVLNSPPVTPATCFGGVGDDGPAECADPLAEECQGHDGDDERLSVDIVADDHAGRQQHADDDRRLAGRGQ